MGFIVLFVPSLFLPIINSIIGSGRGPRIRFSFIGLSNFNQTLADIGIESGYLINVEFTTYPRFSNQPCTRKNRNPQIKYKDGIKFEFSLRDKLTFCLEKCFSKTTKTGTSYVEILKYVLTNTNRPIEINTIQEKIEEMTNLTHSYLSGIQKILKKLFLL